MTASPKPSFRAPWREGNAVVGGGNAAWATTKSGHPCPCQNLRTMISRRKDWTRISADLPSGGWDVTVYVFGINQQSLPTPFYFILVSVSVFMALSTVFHFISPDNSPFSHSVLPALPLPYWSFQLYSSLWKSPSNLI